jgi:hypothetical protein
MDIRLVFRRARFAPSVTITARIEEQPCLPDSPRFVFRWWLAGMGPVASLMGPALALFTTLPPGIVVDGDRMVVNLAEVLEEHGGRAVFNSVTALRADIHREMLLVSFALDISNPNPP